MVGATVMVDLRLVDPIIRRSAATAGGEVTVDSAELFEGVANSRNRTAV